MAVCYIYIRGPTPAICLPQSIEKPLDQLARRIGRTKSCYVRVAILQQLKNLEDLCLAERALERIRSGVERTMPLEAVMKRDGVEN